jgi:hypothetical protein
MTYAQTRAMFYSAAIFNWLAVVVVLPAFGLANYLDMKPALSNSPFEQIAVVSIALFGLGYWIAGNDPRAHRGVILLGALGKLAVVAIVWGHYFFSHDVSLNLAILTFSDLAYAVLFFHVLRNGAGRGLARSA